MNPAKVLIVDDNVDLSHALELRLHANDYQTMMAQDGASAVAIALAHPPIAILLDLHLPNEDGLTVLRELHSYPVLSTVPVIVVSADSSPPTQDRVFDAGAYAFLDKPVNHRLLLQILRDIQTGSKAPERLKVTAQPFPL